MSSQPLAITPLNGWHASHGGRLVEFAGWSMPVQYSSISDEHQAVRNRVGLFDISHMGRLECDGPDALEALERATTNHVARLAPGQVQYSLICNERGGIRDDVLVYRLPGGRFLMVCNASNRAKVIEHLKSIGGTGSAGLRDATEATAMIAVQGPSAAEVIGRVIPGGGAADLDRYHSAEVAVLDGTPVWISRTGYTGEDGFELIVPADMAVRLWEELLEQGASYGIQPCGLGARDTLRLEAGLPLYGHELDESIHPYEAGLGWAVKLGKGPFVGREALERLRSSPGRIRVGLVLEGKRIARQGAEVRTARGEPIGVVTSGTFSPTLQRSIAMAYVESGTTGPLRVEIRGTETTAELVPLPFYRRRPQRAPD
ncbi:MAG: aminomethyltransferase [Isosphaeraceae bacterium]|nr:MAG: aminomethyltransferase [Isosphaeraceae bacterium]